MMSNLSQIVCVTRILSLMTSFFLVLVVRKSLQLFSKNKFLYLTVLSLNL